MSSLRVQWRELSAGSAWPTARDAGEEEFFEWSMPAEGTALVGIGAICELRGHGPERFLAARRARNVAEASLEERGRPSLGTSSLPRWVGGFAFEDQARGAEGAWLPPLRFVLPEVLFWRIEGRSFVAEASGECDVPGPALAYDAVEAALRAEDPVAAPGDAFDGGARAIRAGDLRKLVVTRRFPVELREPVDHERVVARLAAAHPAAHHYRLQRGARAFVGASPERLLRVRGDRVEADALAGSSRRSACPLEDLRLRTALVESKKEQEEHAFVVEHIRRELAHGCSDVEAPEAPSVRAIHGIQHLHTPIRARRNEGELLDLVARLHPTPAVAGTPTEAARAWLRAHEGFDRGWYTGGVGWLDGEGGGEIAVALRCALLEGRRAVLYAGAGMVAASRPDAEREEAMLKSAALREALGSS